MVSLNFNDKIQSIANCIKLWNRRALTPIGRITVVRSLLLPLLTNLFSTLPTPNQQILNKINSMFYEFVWQGHQRKKSKVLIKDYDNGGLEMVHVFSYVKNIKILWLNRLISCYSSTCYRFALKNMLELAKIVNFGKK